MEVPVVGTPKLSGHQGKMEEKERKKKKKRRKKKEEKKKEKNPDNLCATNVIELNKKNLGRVQLRYHAVSQSEPDKTQV